MYCKDGGLRRQRTEDQAFISLHLQTDQIRKSFNTNVFSLNSKDLSLPVLEYMQHH